MERLPERARTPAVARAVVSPSALLLAGAGTAAGVLVGLPLVAAAGIGLLAWGARVALAIPRSARGERIDPFSVKEPWRRFVQDALQARDRFSEAVRRGRPGPLAERLGDIGRRLDHAVAECWQIAKQGHALQDGLRQLDIESAQRRLDEVVAEQARLPDGDPTAANLAGTVESVRAQVASHQRLVSVAEAARSRLRLLNAQMDESVARAVELTLRAADTADLAPLTTDVDNLVIELEALRHGLAETGG
ncbi:MAG: hypothetical protein ACRD0D_08180, partial [Acidimicrobiales bacterium]